MRKRPDNVIPLGMITKLDLPVETVLDAAYGNLESMVIMGYDKNGDEYFASTFADGGQVIWLTERLKKALMDIPDEE